MHNSSGLRFPTCHVDEVLLQPFSPSVPKLIAFFGNDPSNVGIDVLQVHPPIILIHFRQKPAHGNSCCPDNDVDNSRVRENEARIIVPAIEVLFQLLCGVDERWHPKALVVNRFRIKKVIRELLIGRLVTGPRNRVRKEERREQK